jgi:hypothetical protein
MAKAKWRITTTRWIRLAAMKGKAANRCQVEAPVRSWETILSVSLTIRRMTRLGSCPTRVRTRQTDRDRAIASGGACLAAWKRQKKRQTKPIWNRSKAWIRKSLSQKWPGRRDENKAKVPRETRRKPRSSVGRPARKSGWSRRAGSGQGSRREGDNAPRPRGERPWKDRKTREKASTRGCFSILRQEGRELCRPVICISVRRVIRDVEPAPCLSLPGAAK